MVDSKFRYRERSYEDINHRATQSTGTFDSIFKVQLATFKPKEGTNVIRFLPPGWDNARHYAYDVHVHNDIGADHSSYLCLKEMLGEPCPICEERVRIAADGATTEELAKLRPGKRALSFIIDRDNESTGPQCFNMSITQDKDISTLCLDKRHGTALLIDDPENGYDVSFVREGQKLQTRYRGYQIDRNPSNLTDDDRRFGEWLEFIMDHQFPQILEFKDYDYLASTFSGQREAPSDREREVGEPIRRGSAVQREPAQEPERDREAERREPDQDRAPPRQEPERQREEPRQARNGADRNEPAPRVSRVSRESSQPSNGNGSGNPREERVASRRSETDEETGDDTSHDVSEQTRNRLSRLGQRD